MRAFIPLAALLLIVASGSFASVYTGSLSYSPPAPVDSSDGLFVSGYHQQWPAYNVTISWTVTDEDLSQPDHPWKYTYTFDLDGNNGGAISHIIIEAAADFGIANMVGLTGASLSSVGSQAVMSGNPGMPEDLFGLRFDPVEEDLMSMTWSFYSDRAPEWGDFFARCGNRQNLGVNIAYNYNLDSLGTARGFLDPDGNDGVLDDIDPLAAPSSGSVDFHILRPGVVPEPATMTLLALGALAMLRRRGRKG